jgi:hypothetical protein
MPVPIYLLFDSRRLLTQEGVCFTRGRLDSTTEIESDAAFLQSIPFKDVYHDTYVEPRGAGGRRSEILNARHAEVLVPTSSTFGT